RRHHKCRVGIHRCDRPATARDLPFQESQHQPRPAGRERADEWETELPRPLGLRCLCLVWLRPGPKRNRLGFRLGFRDWWTRRVHLDADAICGARNDLEPCGAPLAFYLAQLGVGANPGLDPRPLFYELGDRATDAWIDLDP